ncbi:MAG: cysteine peptidase family C39 domain-containing protein [Candidatus Jorgensenbacteria bacterium]|nr:cysteine peptidase family C39 domain-containing protein [Candidatus Jorgensenbacteria bacterium]
MKRKAIKLLNVKPFQETPGFCGPASLKMVLAYYGLRKSERELVRLSGATRSQGVEAPGLAKVARRLGFTARIKDRATLADIKKHVGKGIPVIVDWFSKDDGHYSVVVGITKSTIYLQDPEIRRVRAMDVKTFKRVWFDFPGDILRSKNAVILQRILVIHR